MFSGDKNKNNGPLIFLFFLGLTFNFFVFLNFKEFEKEIFQLYYAQFSERLFFKKPKSITLIFVGDIMLDRGVAWMVKKYGNGDWKFPFLNIVDELRKADILFGNLEGPISNNGKKVGSVYSFRMDLNVIEGLKFSGFNILSLANNHIFDYGKIAMEDTFLKLKSAGIDFVGAGFNSKEACGFLIKEINGTKIAFLAFSQFGSPYSVAKENSSGLCLLDEKIVTYIKEAKKMADIVVVSIHWGDEYNQRANDGQRHFAILAAEAGADLIIGHHPHVVQENETYKQTYIFYSLGNFIFDQGFSQDTMRGLLLKVIVESGKITKIIPLEVKINEKFQPEIVK